MNGHLDNDLADALLRTLEVHPSLIVPLLVGGEPVGAMIVADRDSPAIRLPTDILQVIGEHLGVTLQSAYLRDASRHQAEALATLNRIACTITSSLDIEEVIQRTMAGINEILDVEAGSLLLVDERTNELYFKITLRGENTSVTAFRLKPGQGIAGWAVARCLPVIVNDVSKDPRFSRRVDVRTGFLTKSILGVPLQISSDAEVGTRFVGVACSSGIATGRARIIMDPGEAGHFQSGEILVAPYTNPGWTPLFSMAAGIVMVVLGLLTVQRAMFLHQKR